MNMMVNSPDCFTSLFSSQLTLTLSANSESLPIMSPMQYNNYVTLHHIWAYMHCIQCRFGVTIHRTALHRTALGPYRAGND